MSEPVVGIDDLSVSFPTDDGMVRAVRNVSFDVNPGEVVAIVGESGSGKSVMALATMRLHPKMASVTGAVRFYGRDLLSVSEREMRGIRGNGIAMVFQDPMTALNPVMKVGAQIAEMLDIHGNISKREAWAQATGLLESVGVPEPGKRVNQYPHEFSGGMRQRAMIAMAIANGPDLLIADEPTTALDVTIQAQVLEVMKAAQEATGAAIMLITHDLGVVAGIADRVVVMYGGRVFEEGSAREVFYRSQNPYTRGLMSSIPRLDSPKGERLIPIPGTPPNVLSPPPGCAFSPRCPYVGEQCLRDHADLRVVGGNSAHRSRCHRLNQLPALFSQEIR